MLAPASLMLRLVKLKCAQYEHSALQTAREAQVRALVHLEYSMIPVSRVDWRHNCKPL